MVWVSPEGSVIVGNGPVVVPLVEVSVATPAVGFGTIGLERNRGAVVGDGAVVVSLVEVGVAPSTKALELAMSWAMRSSQRRMIASQSTGRTAAFSLAQPSRERSASARPMASWSCGAAPPSRAKVSRSGSWPRRSFPGLPRGCRPGWRSRAWGRSPSSPAPRGG